MVGLVTHFHGDQGVKAIRGGASTNIRGGEGQKNKIHREVSTHSHGKWPTENSDTWASSHNTAEKMIRGGDAANMGRIRMYAKRARCVFP